MNIEKIVILISAISIFGLLACCEILFNISFNRNADRKKILQASANIVPRLGIENKHVARSFEENVTWLSNVSHREFFVKSYDGIKLHAYEFTNKNKTDNYCICLHGYSGKPEDNFELAEAFLKMGFNVIVPSMRGHSKSEGAYICMGYPERLDVLTFTNNIVKENPNSKIIVYGISMGAACAMMFSGEKLPDNVKCIIEDCGYSSVYNELKYELWTLFKLPPYPILNIVDKRAKKRLGYSIINEGNCMKAVEKSKTPILFVHGGKDTFVPTKMVYDVYGSACCEKDLLIIENAGHAMSVCAEPKKYWDKIRAFIKKHADIDTFPVI